MSATLLGVTSLIYAAVAVSLFVEGKLGMSLAMICYSIANVGLILAMRHG